jgi:hypothetical protein
MAIISDQLETIREWASTLVVRKTSPSLYLLLRFIGIVDTYDMTKLVCAWNINHGNHSYLHIIT